MSAWFLTMHTHSRARRCLQGYTKKNVYLEKSIARMLAHRTKLVANNKLILEEAARWDLGARRGTGVESVGRDWSRAGKERRLCAGIALTAAGSSISVADVQCSQSAGAVDDAVE